MIKSTPLINGILVLLLLILALDSVDALTGPRRPLLAAGNCNCSWQQVATADASNSPSIAFTNLGSCRGVRITYSNVVPATGGANLVLLTSTNNGTSYDNGAGNYEYAGPGTDATAGTVFIYTNSASAVNFMLNPVTLQASGIVQAVDFNKAVQSQIFNTVWGQYSSNSHYNSGQTTGVRLNSTARNALLLEFDSGNITSGHFIAECMPG